MKVSDTTLFDLQAARIRVPSGGTRMFVAGSAQSGCPQEEDEPREDSRTEHILEILRARRRPMAPGELAVVLGMHTPAVSKQLYQMGKRGLLNHRSKPGIRGHLYELREV